MQQTRALKITTATLWGFATPLAKSTEMHQLATAVQGILPKLGRLVRRLPYRRVESVETKARRREKTGGPS